MMQKLMDENAEIKKLLESLEEAEVQKFEEIKKKLGLEYPVDTLIVEKIKGKEQKYVLMHQEAHERCQTLQEINSELKEKLKQTELKKELSSK